MVSVQSFRERVNIVAQAVFYLRFLAKPIEFRSGPRRFPRDGQP